MLFHFLLIFLLASSALAQAGVKRQLLWQKLQAAIEQTGRELDGVLGVAILDLTTGEELLLHPDEVFPQASAIKIAVLAELYRQHSAGQVKLTDLYTVRQSDLVEGSDIMLGLTPGVTQLTLRDLATMMVAVSDNSATNVLIERLGMANVESMLQGLGLKNTHLRRKMMDVKAAADGRENLSTPREMMTLLALIYRGKLFSKELTDDFFKVLSTPKESALRSALPEGVRIANKTGSLEAVRVDLGVVFAGNRPFVICVMTTYLQDGRAGTRAIAKIGRAAFGYFDRVGRASDYGRVVSSR